MTAYETLSPLYSMHCDNAKIFGIDAYLAIRMKFPDPTQISLYLYHPLLWLNYLEKRPILMVL